tara:strand:- start:13175 stop:14629 length:1455 start_codon:yes stop_codon:yes gene_type:complete
VYPYEDFQGIDASRDVGALDTGQKQHMVEIKDGFADWRGTLVRDPGAEQRAAGNKYIKRVDFFGRDLAVWAQVDGGGTTLRSERDHLKEEVYPVNAVVTSTVYNNKVVFASRDYGMYNYDGFSWRAIEANSDPRPAYIASIQRRLAVAGMPGKRTVIDFSRVDNESVFTADEDEGAQQVTKAADIDVGNIIGTADEITGLGVFENSRLAVFTNDQTLVYQLHPDFTQWQIDDKANIKVGCISHNTITQAGADLLFCSRDGIHSLRRSETNGITIYTNPMSNKIDLTYRELLRNVNNLETISAFYDQDEGQYHVFFPFSDQITKRLTLSLNPMQGGESKWSSGEFLNATCGVQLGGQTLIGTPGGVWERKRIEDVTTHSPEMVVTTPILWQGAINDTKESYSFILQATGRGELQVEAFDERGRYLSAIQFLIEGGGADDKFPDVPLQRQYERKFEHRYRGVQFRFTTKGKGLLKIIGFAVQVRSS